MWCAAVLALALAGCGQTGAATTRVDQAEAEVVAIVTAIVEAVSLETDEVPEFGRRQPCNLPTQDNGAVSALSLRGALPGIDDPVGRASAVLVAAGYELVDSEEELGEGVFGRRDGIRITVVVDSGVDQLAVDASTGCRALPR